MYIYSSYESEENNALVDEYQLALNQFREINSTKFDNYVYIEIKVTNPNYYYHDFMMIYDTNRPIDLKANEVLTINNFLSNNKYIINYPVTDKNLIIFYNTQNTENNKRIITIQQGENIYLNKGTESIYNELIHIETNETLKITIENEVNDEVNNKPKFSIVIYESENEYNFNEISPDNIEINYIFNNETQIFYFYADISAYEQSSTFNFKLNYNYFTDNNFEIKSKILDLDEEISQQILEENIPQENFLNSSYDEESDEYFRIYFNNKNHEKKFSYLLISLEIKDESFYHGGRVLEVSLSNQTNVLNYEEIEYGKFEKIERETINYIPLYEKLILNHEETYIITSQNELITTFIKGDLLEGNNINTNYLDKSNEIIVLSNIKELTIKIFGPGKKVIFYIQRMERNNFEYRENERNKNEIYTYNMEKDQVRYILGTFNIEEYSYGELKVNYYATIDSGNFDLFYINNISLDDNSVNLFPLNVPKYSQTFNEIITLKTNLDLFAIRCKENGIISIRPQYKTFDENTHLIEANSFNKINTIELSEVIQLSVPITPNSNILYLSLTYLNYNKLLRADNEIEYITIIPDTPGIFNNTTIGIDELFKASVNLSEYKPDQLAFYINSNVYSNWIEITEVIQDKYTKYEEIILGENNDIKSNNVFIPILNDNQSAYINITIENLQNEKISVGILQTLIDDINYIASADKYPNMVKRTIKKSKETFSIKNEYYNNQTNEINYYFYFIMSIENKKDNLNYNIKIDFTEEEEYITPSDTDTSSDIEPESDSDSISDITDTSDGGSKGSNEDDSTTTTIIIVVSVIVGVALIVVTIFLIIHFRKKNSSEDIEKISSLEPSNQMI